MPTSIPALPPECWLAKAFEYCRTRSRAPDEIVFWTLMAYCGAALQDRIVINWAPKPIFPNLPVLIVSPSGRGKTGAARTITPLFDDCLPYQIPEDSTAESVLRDMAVYARSRTGNNSVGLWIVPELADVFGRKDYQQGMIARVTRLLDAPWGRQVSRMSLGQMGHMVINGYAVLTWIAGTTMEWLTHHVEEAVASGGFLPRLLTVYSGQFFKFIPDPQRDLVAEKELNLELRQLLAALPNQTSVVLPPYWLEITKGIYEDQKELDETPGQVFVARREENLLRVWLILSVFTNKPAATLPWEIDSNSTLDVALSLIKTIELSGIEVAERLKVLKITGYDPYERVKNLLQSSKRWPKLLDNNDLTCRKNDGSVTRQITFREICRLAHVRARHLKFVLKDMMDTDEIEWNGKTGEAGIIKLIAASGK